MRCLNGLTDGWALLMDSMESILCDHQLELSSKTLLELQGMLAVVKDIVFRR